MITGDYDFPGYGAFMISRKRSPRRVLATPKEARVLRGTAPEREAQCFFSLAGGARECACGQSFRQLHQASAAHQSLSMLYSDAGFVDMEPVSALAIVLSYALMLGRYSFSVISNNYRKLRSSGLPCISFSKALANTERSWGPTQNVEEARCFLYAGGARECACGHGFRLNGTKRQLHINRSTCCTLMKAS